MKHLEILDSHGNHNYIYFENCVELTREFVRMYGIIEADGHGLMSEIWDLDAGILLKNDQEVIAGIFLNFSKNSKSILILATFVEETHRNKGIYNKLHLLLDKIGKESGRTEIYCYIHPDNHLMMGHITEKMRYEPVLHLVKRVI